LLAHGWRFTPDTPASSTTKTGRPDIAEILLKVGDKHNKANQINSTDATTRAGNASASREHKTSSFLLAFYFALYFLCSILSTIVGLYVPFLFAILLSS
jgi:hypothetical protein